MKKHRFESTFLLLLAAAAAVSCGRSSPPDLGAAETPSAVGAGCTTATRRARFSEAAAELEDWEPGSGRPPLTLPRLLADLDESCFDDASSIAFLSFWAASAPSAGRKRLNDWPPPSPTRAETLRARELLCGRPVPQSLPDDALYEHCKFAERGLFSETEFHYLWHPELGYAALQWLTETVRLDASDARLIAAHLVLLSTGDIWDPGRLRLPSSDRVGPPVQRWNRAVLREGTLDWDERDFGWAEPPTANDVVHLGEYVREYRSTADPPPRIAVDRDTPWPRAAGLLWAFDALQLRPTLEALGHDVRHPVGILTLRIDHAQGPPQALPQEFSWHVACDAAPGSELPSRCEGANDPDATLQQTLDAVDSCVSKLRSRGCTSTTWVLADRSEAATERAN